MLVVAVFPVMPRPAQRERILVSLLSFVAGRPAARNVIRSGRQAGRQAGEKAAVIKHHAVFAPAAAPAQLLIS